MSLSRSQNMARIRAEHTTPELALRRELWRRGFRYRLHYPTPGGRPDLVFPGKKVAVFVDGCFWHGCPEHYVRPKTRRSFWADKLRQNVERDRRQTLELEHKGWRVCRFWEHQIHESLEAVISIVQDAIYSPRFEQTEQWRVTTVIPVDGAGKLEHRSLQSLRDGSRIREETRERSTKKWNVKRKQAARRSVRHRSQSV